MSLIASVDARHIGRFFADFGEYCRAVPPGRAGQAGPQRELLGIVLTRGPWVGELSEALESRLPARWSMGLTGLWSMFAPVSPCDLDGLVETLTSLPSPHNLSMLVPVLPAREWARGAPTLWPNGRYAGQVLAPLLQTPSGELRPQPTHMAPKARRASDHNSRHEGQT